MTWELYIKHMDRVGVDKNPTIIPVTARYTNKVNHALPLSFVLHSDHPAAQDFEEFDIVEVFIRNKDYKLTDYTSDFVGIVRSVTFETDEEGQTWVTVYAPEKRHLLSLRDVLWYSGFANRSTFSAVKAETSMKNLVTYNFTSSATVANGRWREGDITKALGMNINLTVQADSAGGNTITGGFSGDNCLEALKDIAIAGGGDFDLVWLGGNKFDFRFYAGQLGSDKSSGANRVVFSLNNYTMNKPKLEIAHAFGTSLLVAGGGEGVNRVVKSVNGPDYSATYDIESFIDARSQGTDLNALQFKGEVEGHKIQKAYELTFDVVQTSNVFYSPIDVTGKLTYKAGDLVLASYQVEEVRKIESVAMTWRSQTSSSSLLIDVETREV